MVFRKLLDNIEDYFCVFLMAVMVICLALQVGTRVITGSSIAWTEELSRYSFIWCVYVGAVRVARLNSHVRITAHLRFLSPRVRLGLQMLVDGIWVCFNLLFAWQGCLIVQTGFLYPEYSPTMNLLKAQVEVIIPTAFVLMSWRIVDGYWIRWRQGTLLTAIRNEEECS